jgi:TolB-like protein/Tfp pilus assembly protein PilF
LKIFAELRRRNVFRAGAFYAASAWLLVQIATQVLPFFHIAEWVVRWIIVASVVGFPFAMLFAWFYEWTPQGFQRESELPPNDALTRRTGRKLDRWIIAILSLAVILLLTDKLVLQKHETGAINPAAKAKSIAVLPFENLSNDPENAYFAEGIQDEILTRLAKVADLKVISRTSTQRFKSSPEDLAAIAKQLGVVHVLEGTMQRANEKVRVNVQLINAANDAHVWAETYDRELTDIFAVESEIAKSVADALRAKLTAREAEAITARPTENKAAYDLYLRGRFFWFKRTADDLEKAASCFQQAIEIDPKFSLAYVGLADALVLMPAYGAKSPQAAYPPAKAAAQKAIALDPNLAEAHASFGKVLWNQDFDFAQSIREFETALKQNANYATAHHWYGNSSLACLGRFDQAVKEVRRAVELDPLSLIFNADLGGTLVLARRYDEAIDQLRRTLELDPSFGYTHYNLGQALEMRGELAGAIAAYEKARQLGNDPMPSAYLAHAYARSGRRADALRLQQELTEAAKKRYVPTFAFAVIALGLDDRARTLDLLEQAFEARESRFIAYLNVDPFFDRLRDDPRFVRLVERVLAKK